MWVTRRAWLAHEALIIFGIFSDFGLRARGAREEGRGQMAPPGSVVLFYPKPARCYTDKVCDKVAFDGVDLSDIDIDNGRRAGGGGVGGEVLGELRDARWH
jgi:hypothetical protein